MENGARLGWLIDPDSVLECLDNPASVSGEEELPGFRLDLQRVWNPGF